MPQHDATTSRRAYDPFKRLVDLAVSSVGLLVLMPILLLVAGLIKLTSKGPALYRARRAGVDGEPFDVLKFRTMVMHADRSEAITSGGDSRITSFGRLLRHTKLDELPQLWNILCGKMSLVGPRPESLSIVEQHFSPEQLEVLAIRPGLTCTGTLYFYLCLEHLQPPVGVGPEEFYVRDLLESKISGDLHYVRHRTLSYEVWLLAQTARVVMLRIFGVQPRWSPPTSWRPEDPAPAENPYRSRSSEPPPRKGRGSA